MAYTDIREGKPTQQQYDTSVKITTGKRENENETETEEAAEMIKEMHGVDDGLWI